MTQQPVCGRKSGSGSGRSGQFFQVRFRSNTDRIARIWLGPGKKKFKFGCRICYHVTFCTYFLAFLNTIEKQILEKQSSNIDYICIKKEGGGVQAYNFGKIDFEIWVEEKGHVPTF